MTRCSCFSCRLDSSPRTRVVSSKRASGPNSEMERQNRKTLAAFGREYDYAVPKKKATKPPTVAPETRILKWFFGHIFSLLRRHGNVVVFWLGIAYCAHEASVALRAYAGHISTADLSLRILGSFAGTISLSISASGLSISLYLKERREHRATRERLAAEKEVLEKLLDVRRTSSLLTPEGQTRKGDE